MMSIIEAIQGTKNFTMTIGTSPECDLSYNSPVYITHISAHHAALKRKRKNYYLRDLGSKQGTFVNGKRISGRWTRIALHDDINLGLCQIKVAGLFLQSPKVSLEARDLNYSIQDRRTKNSRQLIGDISFRAEAGELIAILGPSGAGKTILLGLLSGALKPTRNATERRGSVYLNDKFSVHEERDLVNDFIGFVPQDDMMFSELSVGDSLGYSLNLKFSDSGIDKKYKQKKVEETARKLGFEDEKLMHFLGTKIGSPDTGRGLSGGERKKANIAHELIKNPLLLFLDEPTSGLSSVDSDNIIKLLRSLSEKDETTIITTIHQPSEDSFYQFDKVLILNYGGITEYYGSPKDAVSHFERVTRTPSGNKNPAEFVLEALACSIPTLQNNKTYQPQTTNKSPSKAGVKYAIRKTTIPGFWRQFTTLLKRNWSINRADCGNLLFQVLQPVIITALIIGCFWGFNADYQKKTLDEKIVYYITNISNGNHGLALTDSNLDKAENWAHAPDNNQVYSQVSANRFGTISFIMIISAIWLGIINTCREIIGEKPALIREGRSYLRMSSYLGSKFIYYVLLSSLQVGIITAGVKFGLLKNLDGLYFWGLMSATASCASAIGLALSSAVNSQRVALTAVPLIILPQLLYGGLIRPVKYFGEVSINAFALLPHLMLQKWAFLASLFSDNFMNLTVLKMVTNFRHWDVAQRLHYQESSLVELYFPIGQKKELFILEQAWGVIGLQCFIFLLIAYIFLKTKYGSR